MVWHDKCAACRPLLCLDCEGDTLACMCRPFWMSLTTSLAPLQILPSIHMRADGSHPAWLQSSKCAAVLSALCCGAPLPVWVLTNGSPRQACLGASVIMQEGHGHYMYIYMYMSLKERWLGAHAKPCLTQTHSWNLFTNHSRASLLMACNRDLISCLHLGSTHSSQCECYGPLQTSGGHGQSDLDLHGRILLSLPV